MTTQEILNQLAAGNFQVQVPYDIPKATSRIGTIQELHMFGNDAACAVFFPGMKWNIIFHVADGDDKKRRYTRDLQPVPLKEETIDFIFTKLGWRISDVSVDKEDTDSPIVMELDEDDVLVMGYELGDENIWWEAHQNKGQWVIVKKWYRNEVCQLWNTIYTGRINSIKTLHLIMDLCGIPITAPNDERSVATDALSE
jgi:hypothetical protein